MEAAIDIVLISKCFLPFHLDLPLPFLAGADVVEFSSVIDGVCAPQHNLSTWLFVGVPATQVKTFFKKKASFWNACCLCLRFKLDRQSLRFNLQLTTEWD